MRNLNGKVAVVTGGGSGIGRATVLELAKLGVTVAIADLDLGRAEAVAGEVTAAGGKATAHKVDVSSEADFHALREEVLAAHGVVDILVNNAGIGPAPRNFVDVDLAYVRRFLDVNLWGAINGSHTFLPDLLSRPEASLVNIGSYTGLMAPAGVAAYATSKFGVRGFTESLRMELAGSPVTTTLVVPGVTRTALMANSPVIADDQKDGLQKAFDKSPAVGPEVVAKGIIKGIQGKKPRVRTGKDTVALDIITRLAPARYSTILAKPMKAVMKKTFGQ
jgi:NAD(P)-dependent dehydrogenase (short-subunit alcohol dehydrogenase family)